MSYSVDIAVPHASTAQNGIQGPLKDQRASYMSLPKKGQLAILCLARIADPLAISSIQVHQTLLLSLLQLLLTIPLVLYVLATQILRSTSLGCNNFHPGWDSFQRSNCSTGLYWHDLGALSGFRAWWEEDGAFYWVAELQ